MVNYKCKSKRLEQEQEQEQEQIDKSRRDDIVIASKQKNKLNLSEVTLL